MAKPAFTHQLLPVQPWELSLADVSGFSISQLRFAVAFFSSIPVAILLGRLRSPKLRHWFSLLTGLMLIFYPFGNGCLHALVTTTVTYLIMTNFRQYCGTLTWLFAMPYLIANHIAQASGMAWKEGQLDFTAAQMILTLKLIAVAMCYQDGARGDELPLREYAKTKRLKRLPSPLEFFSYCFAAGNLLSGPFFEAKDYFDFMNGQGDWAQLSNHTGAAVASSSLDGEGKQKVTATASRKKANPTIPGSYRFFKALAFAALWIFGERAGFTVPYLESDAWSHGTSLPARLALLWFTVVVFRFKYYFVWAIAEAGLVFSGFGFAGFDDKGKAKWDRYINSRVRGVEMNTSLADTPRHWNILTGLWLRHYVYERLVPPGRKPRFQHLMLTQLVSGVWHGVFAGYWLFFATSALMFEASKTLHRYERTWRPAIRNFLPWKGLKMVATALVLNYAGSAFMVLSFGEAFKIWRAVYYFAHVLILALFVIGAVMPPRRASIEKQKHVHEQQREDEIKSVLQGVSAVDANDENDERPKKE